MAKLKITRTRSSIGRTPKQRATIVTLGLRKIGQSVVRDDTPSVRGLIQVVRHMVEVEEVE
ncbi:50S ribosomal protein L30 [Gleimia hominis]|uniref:Large ribosomal subunit protein uL30 n=1 Tax=Gleimia hominis TaxID=595468 RepID=A0ABU3I9W0_9ACTO|nr:50S ribosomal protein L30 [Gleimia hominis]MDT3767157.1 50S ribosomal protein L30 [Gleimia hominis]WIK64595.1 50S ribosomal protein L30 [Gleimia hominis]